MGQSRNRPPRRAPGRRSVVAVIAGAIFAFFFVLLALTPTRLPVLVPFTVQQLWVANHPGSQEPGSSVARIRLTGDGDTGHQDHAVRTSDLPSGVGMTTDGSEVFVTNRGAGTLSVIDATNGRVTKTIRVGKTPDAVAVGAGPGGASVAVVADVLSDDASIVNLGTMRVERTVRVGVWPSAIDIVPGGSRGAGLAVITDYGSGQVSFLDLGTLRVRSTLPIGELPDAVAVVPGGPGNAGELAVTNAASDDVRIVDLAPRQPIRPPIRLPASPTEVAGNGTDTVWVGEGTSLVPLDVLNGDLGPVITLPRPVQSIALEASGAGAWVGERGGLVQHVDLETGALGQEFVVGGLPQSLVITTQTELVAPKKK